MSDPPSHGRVRRARAGAVAGIFGGVAFAIEQEIDLRVCGYPSNDYVLLGGLFGGSPKRSKRIGVVIHLVNSAALGAVYGLTLAERTRFFRPAEGALFAIIENTVLYPALLFERVHPLIRSGSLPSYRSRVAFAQETLRHIAFGAATGAAYTWLVNR